MLSKNQLKNLAAYRLQKHCDDDGLFVVEGVKMCNEALLSGFTIRTICATADYLNSTPVRNRIPLLSGSGCDIHEVTDDQLERLSNQRTPNKVWMLLDRQPSLPCPATSSDLTLALDGLQDPGNMGTILRTADWFGIRHVVCSVGTVSCYNPKVVQSTMGSLFRTEIIYTDLPSYLSECGMPVYGALLDGEDIWGDGHPLHLQPGGSVLVIGNESRGITPEVQQHVTHRIMIPNLGGTAESLNASVACAILIAEMVRKVAR